MMSSPSLMRKKRRKRRREKKKEERERSVKEYCRFQSIFVGCARLPCIFFLTIDDDDDFENNTILQAGSCSTLSHRVTIDGGRHCTNDEIISYYICMCVKAMKDVKATHVF